MDVNDGEKMVDISQEKQETIKDDDDDEEEEVKDVEMADEVNKQTLNQDQEEKISQGNKQEVIQQDVKVNEESEQQDKRDITEEILFGNQTEGGMTEYMYIDQTQGDETCPIDTNEMSMSGFSNARKRRIRSPNHLKLLGKSNMKLRKRIRTNQVTKA